MGAVVDIWLESLISTYTWGQLHSAMDDVGEEEKVKMSEGTVKSKNNTKYSKKI